MTKDYYKGAQTLHRYIEVTHHVLCSRCIYLSPVFGYFVEEEQTRPARPPRPIQERHQETQDCLGDPYPSRNLLPSDLASYEGFGRMARTERELVYG
jgi:hypothetical protein